MEQKKIALLLVIVFCLLAATTLFTADRVLSLNASNGPLLIWLQSPFLFILLAFSALCVFIILPRINDDPLFFAAALIVICLSVVKLLFPYLIFDNLHYDSFSHYSNVRILSESGVQPIGYLFWPSTFLLTSSFTNISSIVFPLNSILLAIVPNIILIVVLFTFIKNLFGRREAILSTLFLTLVLPYSPHYSPFTIGLALTFLAFVVWSYAIFLKKDGLVPLALIVSLSIIPFHAFLPYFVVLLFVVPLFVLFICSKLNLSSYCQYKYDKIKKLLISGVLIVSGAFIWWLYVSSTFKTLMSRFVVIFTGEQGSTFSLGQNLYQVGNQLATENLLGRYTRYLAVIFALFSVLFILYVMLFKRQKLQTNYIKILSLVITAFSQLMLAFIFQNLIPIGFSERFFNMSYLLFTIISGVCIVQFLMNGKIKKKLYAIVMILFTFAVVVSPLTDTTAYSTFYYSGITKPDINIATFTADYVVLDQPLTGDLRFQGIVELLAGSSLITLRSFSWEFENNVLSGSYTYSASAILTGSVTADYLTMHGINASQTVGYVSRMPDSLNLVYDNGYDQIFVPSN